MEAADRVGIKGSRRSTELSILSMDAVDESDGLSNEGFDIMSNVIWAEVSRAIMDDLGSLVFASGKPDEFRKVGAKY